MVQCNKIDVKISNQMLKIKVSRKQYAAKVVRSLSSNMISDGEFIIPYKLLLTDRQLSNFC